MKKKTRKQKNAISMSVIMLMLAAGMFTACSNSKTEETTAVEGTEQVEESAQDDAAITEQDQENEDTAASENVEESEAAESEGAEETETQSVVYEGINMDSTLQGLEWMDTFDGIIHEPKIVVFNDETNKKVIVENGDTVEFALTDILATYIPTDKEYSVKYPFSDRFKKYECVGRYIVESELLDEYKTIGDTFQYANIIVYGDDEVKIWCELKIVE